MTPPRAILPLLAAALLPALPSPSPAQETETHRLTLSTPALVSAIPAVSNSLSALPPLRLSWSLVGNPVDALAAPPPPDGLEILIPSSSFWIGCTFPSETEPARPSLIFRRSF